MIAALRNERGVALVTTLGVVVILLVAATQVGRMAGGAAMQTRAENDLFSAREQVLSGIHLGMMILVKDAADNQTDSVQETWSDPDKLERIVKHLDFDAGWMTLDIKDEMGKIQLNAQLREFPGNEADPGQQALLARFFSLVRKNEASEGEKDSLDIVNAVKDWLDTNDNDAVSGLSGAESDYYEGLETPYPCANGPFNQVSELYNVKGMDKVKPAVSVRDFFTVYGLLDGENDLSRYAYSGKININTAPLEVLAALMPEGRDHLAEEVAAFRGQRASEEEQYSNLLEPGWFEKVIELSAKEKKVLEGIITYSSHIFRITCRVQWDTSAMELSAVVQRQKHEESGKWTCRVLQMEPVS